MLASPSLMLSEVAHFQAVRVDTKGGCVGPAGLRFILLEYRWLIGVLIESVYQPPGVSRRLNLLCFCHENRTPTCSG